MHRNLDHMAHFDALTNLPNRSLFTDRLQQALLQAERYSRLLAVMFIDLDNFKNVNDTLGHSAGDALLKMAAQRITDSLRKGDTVARLGGDEFIVMLPELGSAQDASQVAQKILSALAQTFELDQHELHISASIGISSILRMRAMSMVCYLHPILLCITPKNSARTIASSMQLK